MGEMIFFLKKTIWNRVKLTLFGGNSKGTKPTHTEGTEDKIERDHWVTKLQGFNKLSFLICKIHFSGQFFFHQLIGILFIMCETDRASAGPFFMVHNFTPSKVHLPDRSQLYTEVHQLSYLLSESDSIIFFSFNPKTAES